MNQGVAFSVFSTGRSKSNAAVPHGDVLSQFNLEGIVFFYNADVIGCCKFASTAKDVEGFPVFLSDGSRFCGIIAGELQVGIAYGRIHVCLRGNVAHFEGRIVVTGKRQRVVFKFPFFNVYILQAVNRNFTVVLHGQGNGARTVIRIGYVAGFNLAAFELTQVDDVCIYRTGGYVSNLITTIVETGIG